MHSQTDVVSDIRSHKRRREALPDLSCMLHVSVDHSVKVRCKRHLQNVLSRNISPEQVAILTRTSSAGHWAGSGWGSSGPALSSCWGQTPATSSSPQCSPQRLSIRAHGSGRSQTSKQRDINGILKASRCVIQLVFSKSLGKALMHLWLSISSSFLHPVICTAVISSSKWS